MNLVLVEDKKPLGNFRAMVLDLTNYYAKMIPAHSIPNPGRLIGSTDTESEILESLLTKIFDFLPELADHEGTIALQVFKSLLFIYKPISVTGIVLKMIKAHKSDKGMGILINFYKDLIISYEK